MQKMISILAVLFVVSPMATSQPLPTSPDQPIAGENQFVLRDRGLVREMAKIRALALVSTAAGDIDSCGPCIADQWQQCGIDCGVSCTPAQLQACQDGATLYCTTIGACTPENQ